MVVDHADGLHEGVADGGADEFEAAFFQVLAHRVGLLGRGGNLLERFPLVLNRSSADEGPDIRIETAELLLHGQKGLGVADRRGDFQPVPNDAFILQQLLLSGLAVFRDLGRVETVVRLSVMVPLFQDGLPAQSRLRAFEDQEFEQQPVIMHGYAPFLVVIADVVVRGLSVPVQPRAAFFGHDLSFGVRQAPTANRSGRCVVMRVTHRKRRSRPQV